MGAVHAGTIDLTDGGPVVVEIVAGLPEYAGSARNGVRSAPGPAGDASFRFPTARVVHDLAGTWYTRANQIDAPNSDWGRFECSAGGTGGNVWGTGVYTDDSSICEAAVHAGVITRAEGCMVQFQLLGEQASFEGSERNGVTTMRYPSWPGSFRFDADE